MTRLRSALDAMERELNDPTFEITSARRAFADLRSLLEAPPEVEALLAAIRWPPFDAEEARDPAAAFNARVDELAALVRRLSQATACPDHWHCDPALAAHNCTKPDRSRPCPTCKDARRVSGPVLSEEDAWTIAKLREAGAQTAMETALLGVIDRLTGGGNG